MNFIILFLSGIFAGFINVTSGGGSLLTLPIMMLLGMSPVVANGTNRLAIAFQSISAVNTYKKKGYFEPKKSMLYSLYALPGVILGAISGIKISGELFQQLLAILLILSVFLFNKKTDRKFELNKITILISFLLLGFYIGFIQAGSGFFLIILLHNILGYDIIKTNMHKIAIIGFCTIPALTLFFINNCVYWQEGIALAIGNSIGAWLAGNYAIKWKQTTQKKMVSVMLIIFSIILLLKSFY